MRLSIVVMVILGAGIGWLWWSQQRSTVSPGWQGYAEADYVKVAPIEQGLLTAISVARGDQIARGAPLFTQDDTHERAARDQAARQLAQAEEQLANLEAAMKPTEVAQAEANLTDARSTLERAQADLQRDEALLRTGYSTAQTVDQRRADYKSAQAKAQHAEAALAQARAPMGSGAGDRGAAGCGRGRAGSRGDGRMAAGTAHRYGARGRPRRRRAGTTG